MSNLSGLTRRIKALHKGLTPSPRIIDCTGARDRLIAKLKPHVTEEQRREPTEEEKEKFQQFKAMIAECVKESEQKYNVKHVSYIQKSG